jgi:hypothetical protein
MKLIRDPLLGSLPSSRHFAKPLLCVRFSVLSK